MASPVSTTSDDIVSRTDTSQPHNIALTLAMQFGEERSPTRNEEDANNNGTPCIEKKTNLKRKLSPEDAVTSPSQRTRSKTSVKTTDSMNTSAKENNCNTTMSKDVRNYQRDNNVGLILDSVDSTSKIAGVDMTEDSLSLKVHRSKRFRSCTPSQTSKDDMVSDIEDADKCTPNRGSAVSREESREKERVVSQDIDEGLQRDHNKAHSNGSKQNEQDLLNESSSMMAQSDSDRPPANHDQLESKLKNLSPSQKIALLISYSKVDCEYPPRAQFVGSPRDIKSVVQSVAHIHKNLGKV